MPRRLPTAVLTLAFAVLSIHARGQDHAPVDACALLRAAEISQAIGLSVGDGVRSDPRIEDDGSRSSVCLWIVEPEHPAPADPAGPLGGRSFVLLNAMQWPAGSGSPRTYLEAFRTAAENGEIPQAPVPREFGDEALWWGDGLAVRERDVAFGVSVFVPSLEHERAGYFEERLARHVLRRLEERADMTSAD